MKHLMVAGETGRIFYIVFNAALQAAWFSAGAHTRSARPPLRSSVMAAGQLIPVIKKWDGRPGFDADLQLPTSAWLSWNTAPFLWVEPALGSSVHLSLRLISEASFSLPLKGKWLWC